MKGLIEKTGAFIKRNSANILTGLGVVGVAGTAVLTGIGTVKAIKRIEEAEAETKAEKFKAAVPAYIPATLSGIATVSCIVAARGISQRREASLLSAYTMLNEAFSRYRGEVIERFGSDVDKEIWEHSTCQIFYDGEDDEVRHMFYIDCMDKFVELTWSEVLRAAYYINRDLQLFGVAKVSEFANYLGIDIPPEVGDLMGWTWELGLDYGYSWIDFCYDHVKSDDPTDNDFCEFYRVITPFGPDRIKR